MLPRPLRVLHNRKTSLYSDLECIHLFSDVSLRLQGKSVCVKKSPAGGDKNRCTCVKVAGHKGWRARGGEEDAGPRKLYMVGEIRVILFPPLSPLPALILTDFAWICRWKAGRLREVGGASSSALLLAFVFTTWGFNNWAANILRSACDIFPFFKGAALQTPQCELQNELFWNNPALICSPHHWTEKRDERANGLWVHKSYIQTKTLEQYSYTVHLQSGVHY